MSDERSVPVTLLAITSCHLHLVTVLQPTHLNTRSYALHWIYQLTHYVIKNIGNCPVEAPGDDTGPI